MRAGYCLVTRPAKYVFCGKIPQFTGPWEDLTVKFVFRGMGYLSYKCWSAGKWGHVGWLPEKSSRVGGLPPDCRRIAAGLPPDCRRILFRLRTINSVILLRVSTKSRESPVSRALSMGYGHGDCSQVTTEVRS